MNNKNNFLVSTMTHIFSLSFLFLFSGKLCAENNSPDRCYFSFILYYFCVFGCGHHCYDCCSWHYCLFCCCYDWLLLLLLLLLFVYCYHCYWFNFAKKKEKLKFIEQKKAMHSLVLYVRLQVYAGLAFLFSCVT